jgi:long-chain-acyl-CoA dehydrogenase
MHRTAYDDTHEHFRAAIRSFVDRGIRPSLDAIRAAGRIPDDVWLDAGRLGLLGLARPDTGRASGPGEGVGADYRYNAVAIEELAAVSHGVSASFTIHFDIAAPYLVEHARGDVRDLWWPDVAAGRTIMSLALTEPHAGSDLASLRTRAERTADGWRISGTKTFITNAPIAGLLVVAARTGGTGAAGISLLLVAADAPGVSVTRLPMMGLAESSTGSVAFDNVLVGHDAVLGEVDAGFALLMHHLPHERLSSAIANLAQARAGLTAAVHHAREREMFGTSLGRLQHPRFVLADLSARLEAAAAFIDTCIQERVEDRLTAGDAARAKLLSAQVEHDVLDAAVQLHGGAGLVAGSAIGRAWVDARVTPIWAGSNEVMREIVARDLEL